MSLHRQLLSDTPPTLDKSHFLWLITYFLKFASQLEVELEQIG
jgi:timeless protein